MKPLSSTYVYNVLKIEHYVDNIKSLNKQSIAKYSLSRNQTENILNEFRYKINFSTKNYITEQIVNGKMILINAPNLYLPSWAVISTPGVVDVTFVNLFGKLKIKEANDSMSFNPREIYAITQIGYMLSKFYENEKKIVGNSNIVNLSTEIYMRLVYRILDSLYSIDSATSQGLVTRYMINKFFLINVLGKPNNDHTSDVAFRPLRNVDHFTRLKTAIGNEEPDMYESLPKFIKALPKYVPLLKDLDIGSFLRKFLLTYGEKSLLAIENYNYFIAIVCSSVINGGYIKDFTVENALGKEAIQLYNLFTDTTR